MFNISKDFNSTNAQKTGLYGYVYDFSVDYRAITSDKINDIHVYLIKKTTSYKMFGLIKILPMVFLISNINSLKCVLMKNQEYKAREVIINNEYMIYPFSIKVNRCNGNCNNISNPYSRVCVSNVVKNITAKVFDLMSWKNKTKQIHVSVYVDKIQLFIIINKSGIKINADVSVKNQFIKNIIKILSGILM